MSILGRYIKDTLYCALFVGLGYFIFRLFDHICDIEDDISKLKRAAIMQYTKKEIDILNESLDDE